MADNTRGGVIMRVIEETEEKQRRNDAFKEGFWAGLAVIGGIATALLLIFWL